MHLTTEGLKKMSALSVASLKTEGISLNDSITKVAMDNGMNSDQVKRMVETTNQLAYLSELKDQDDRTFEFDVANYDNIMDGMVPESDLCKQASAVRPSPLDLVLPQLEKVATVKEATIEKWGRTQKLQALKKVASQQRNALDELTSSEYGNLVKMAQHRAIVSRDPEALLKMAKFENGRNMSEIVFGHNKVASEVRMVWSDADMKDIQAFSDTLNMCKEAQERKMELSEKVEKAEGILKEAFMGAMYNAAKSKATGAYSAVANAGKKTMAIGEAGMSINETNNNTKRNHDAWSSLRG